MDRDWWSYLHASRPQGPQRIMRTHRACQPMDTAGMPGHSKTLNPRCHVARMLVKSDSRRSDQACAEDTSRRGTVKCLRIGGRPPRCARMPIAYGSSCRMVMPVKVVLSVIVDFLWMQNSGRSLSPTLMQTCRLALARSVMVFSLEHLGPSRSRP